MKLIRIILIASLDLFKFLYYIRTYKKKDYFMSIKLNKVVSVSPETFEMLKLLKTLKGVSMTGYIKSLTEVEYEKNKESLIKLEEILNLTSPIKSLELEDKQG